jgi:D-3-phosphoglycerate dehydrogenase / 2-oxoglutarate reductase
VELAKRAKAFGMRIVYNDVRTIDPAIVKSLEATFLEKPELFRQADVISINTDLNSTSRTMIDARTIELMKRSAVLICCARGGIIDEVALRDALNADRIAGAGLDVYSPEPIRADNVMLTAKNVVLTPHTAGVTRESIQRSYEWAHENVRRVVQRNEAPRWVVNGLKY